MRRLIAVLAAALMPSLWASEAHAEPVSSVPGAHACAYDTPIYDQPSNYTAPERGPRLPAFN